MTIEKIINDLRERFDAPLRDCYKRRIIFWRDPDGEFSDMIGEIELDGVKIVKLTGNNNFAVKKLLEHDDTESSYLVYSPIVYEDVRDNWLRDVELYSEDFKADLISMRLVDIGGEDTVALRKLVRVYSKFFESRERISRLKALGSKYTSPGQLHIDIMAVLSGTKENTVQGIIKKLLCEFYFSEENTALENIRHFGSEEALKEMLIRSTGFGSSDELDIYALAKHIIVSALSADVERTLLNGLDKYISESGQAFCRSFVCEWQRSEDSGKLFEIATDIEEKLDLIGRLSSSELDNIIKTDGLPCIDRLIISKLMTGTIEQTIRPEAVVSAVDTRRMCGWYDRFEYYYTGAYYAALMHQLWREEQHEIHTGDITELWKLYTEKLCMMDTYYRKIRFALGRSSLDSDPVLEDSFGNIADTVEDLYKNAFLAEIIKQWNDITAEDLKKDMRLFGIPQQSEFYNNKVQPIISGNSRAYVIISDALRYETAKELTAKLTAETNGTAKISAVQSVFPSATKFGMAALLPHDKLVLTDDLHIRCDDISSEGTQNRDKILKTRNKNNIAVQYKSLSAMKRDERRALVNGAQVVYIYHNTIDAAGDEQASEHQIFEACETAMEEIRSLVKMIVNTMGGANIIITADHGFIYTAEPLEEYEKAEKDSIFGDVKEYNRRYAIADSSAAAEGMTEVSLGFFGSELKAFSPKETVRLKVQGGGANYVHGGTSLQEICVPVIEFKNFRSDSKNFVEIRKAEIQLLNTNRKITNSIFTLDFYQTEPVAGKLVEGKYDIYFTDDTGNKVSDVQTVIADMTSTRNEERVIRKKFVMKGEQFDSKANYHLNIAEKDSGEVKTRIDFRLNISFVNDFDF